MNLFTALLPLLLAASSATAGPDVPRKVLKKIAYHQLMGSCWGEDNMMEFYKMLKKTQDECFDLKPTFEINLFEEHDEHDDDHHDHDDHDHDHDHKDHDHRHYTNYHNQQVYKPQPALPFNLPTQHALPVISATRYSPSPATAPTAGSPSPYDAWLAYWAYQQQAQAQAPVPQNKYSMAGFAKPSSPFRRYKRSFHPLTAERVSEFTSDFSMFKSDMVHNLANLTCVLSKMRFLDDQLQVNMDTFERGMWESMPGLEPEFKEKAVAGYRVCHDVSEAVPQEVLDMKPVTRQFGRQMVFFKCIKKMEESLCAKKELASWLEAWHGPISEETQRDLGLPDDKYDAAMLAFKIMDYSKTGTEKFIGDFFFGAEK